MKLKKCLAVLMALCLAANFGIIAPLEKKVKGGKKLRHEALALRSLEIIKNDFSFLCNK